MLKVIAHPATAPKAEIYKRVAWLYALAMVVMVFSQLVGFEKFIPLIDRYLLAGGYGTATLISGLIVVAAVFALPYLLRMRLSDLMRWVSLGCSVFVPFAWIALSFHALLFTSVINGGILGVHLKIGITMQLVLAFVMMGTSLFIAFGMKPKRIRFQ